jgi:hypothetical protein
MKFADMAYSSQETSILTTASEKDDHSFELFQIRDQEISRWSQDILEFIIGIQNQEAVSCVIRFPENHSPVFRT